MKHLISIVSVMAMMLGITACRVEIGNDSGYDNIDEEDIEAVAADKYEFRDFTDIDVSGEVDLYFKQGEKYEIRAKQSDNPDLKLFVKQTGKTLKVYTKNKKKIILSKKYEKPVVYVTAPKLTNIDCSGASVIHSENIESNENMRIEISGASKADFRSIDCNEIKISCIGASYIEGKMKAEKVTIDNTGASNTVLRIESGMLEVDNNGASKSDIEFKGGRVDHSNSGAVKAKLNADCKEISASCSGASNLTISGKTDKTDFDTSGASKINTEELDINR